MPTLRARRPRRLTPLAMAPATALLVALVGCSDTPEIPQADPTPSASPLFASEEEALEAATAIFEEYLAVSGSILRDGGEGPERLEPLVSDDIYAEELTAFEERQQSGTRFTGDATVLGTVLQQASLGNAETTEVQIYACVSNAGVTILNPSGEAVEDQPTTTEITLDVVVEYNDGTLVISQRDLWAQENICVE